MGRRERVEDAGVEMRPQPGHQDRLLGVLGVNSMFSSAVNRRLSSMMTSPGLGRVYGRLRGLAEDVLYEPHFLAQDLRERLGVLLHGDVVVSPDPSLVRSYDRDRVSQVADSHGRLLDPAQLKKLAGLWMDGRIDVDPHEDLLPVEVEVVHRQRLGGHYTSAPSSV